MRAVFQLPAKTSVGKTIDKSRYREGFARRDRAAWSTPPSAPTPAAPKPAHWAGDRLLDCRTR